MNTYYKKIEKMMDEGFLNDLPDFIEKFIKEDIGWDLEEKEWESMKEDEAWIWDDYFHVLTEDNDNQYIDMWDRESYHWIPRNTWCENEWNEEKGNWPGIRYRYIPALWSWFCFWEKVKDKKKKEYNNYLLGEIIWYLILNGYMDEKLYEEHITHVKVKGRKRTNFNEAKAQLIYNGSKPWVPRAQERHGNIIEEESVDVNRKIIYFTTGWRELLDIRRPPYFLV